MNTRNAIPGVFIIQCSMKQDRSIVYMGTPDFAVEPLKRLLEKQFYVKAVVTVADKPAGRGLKVHSSPVKEFALQQQIPVLQPLRLNDPEFVEQLKALNADLFIVVAFRKLPEVIWKLPKAGCFNLHASLLPQYRGAAPINHAVINGEKTTGVTTFFLNDEIDTGKIIMQRETAIGPDETAGEVHDRLMLIGAELVTETVEAIFNDAHTSVNQPDINIELKKAPKIFREDCMINWAQSATSVHNFIRGLSPYPGAFGTLTTSDGVKELKVLKSALIGKTSSLEPGTAIIDNNKMLVACNDEFIEILMVQPAGKRSMQVSDYLRGSRFEILKFT